MLPTSWHTWVFPCAVDRVDTMLDSKGTGKPSSCEGKMVCDGAACSTAATAQEGNHSAGPTVLPRIHLQVGAGSYLALPLPLPLLGT